MWVDWHDCAAHATHFRAFTPQSPIPFTFEKYGRYNELCPQPYSIHSPFAGRAFVASKSRRPFN